MRPGLTLPALLASQARAAVAGKPARDPSLIYLFLRGGPSTIDIWDLKEDLLQLRQRPVHQ